MNAYVERHGRRWRVRARVHGVLRPDEQRAVVAVAPAAWRPVVVLALLTGLRWSELAHLSWTAVRDDHLLVRRSRGGRATKGGRPRVVPLLEAARLTLAELPRTGELVFGGDRARLQRPSAWLTWVRAAGIGRRVRWHDLRHTCATSLLAGIRSQPGSDPANDVACWAAGWAEGLSLGLWLGRKEAA